MKSDHISNSATAEWQVAKNRPVEIMVQMNHSENGANQLPFQA